MRDLQHNERLGLWPAFIASLASVAVFFTFRFATLWLRAALGVLPGEPHAAWMKPPDLVVVGILSMLAFFVAFMLARPTKKASVYAGVGIATVFLLFALPGEIVRIAQYPMSTIHVLLMGADLFLHAWFGGMVGLLLERRALNS
ncbi:hypothetical protein EON81_13020 [bacterium]|nr:MAG: hypothetical protein EON81_13020 [bacterium]